MIWMLIGVHAVTKKVIKNRLLPIPDKGDLSSLRVMVVELSRAFAEYGQRLNAMLPADGSEGFTEYTVSTLPTGVGGALIPVTDEVGGYTFAFYDGTNWRRVQDRAIVS